MSDIDYLFTHMGAETKGGSQPREMGEGLLGRGAGIPPAVRLGGDSQTPGVLSACCATEVAVCPVGKREAPRKLRQVTLVCILGGPRMGRQRL